jgi:aspartate aminotransferase-like enzyme
LKEGIFRIDIMGWMPEGYMVGMLEVLGGGLGFFSLRPLC